MRRSWLSENRSVEEVREGVEITIPERTPDQSHHKAEEDGWLAFWSVRWRDLKNRQL